MRLGFVGCLLVAVSGCTTAMPQVPACAITPDPVQVGDAYTVQLTQASPGTSVVLRLNSSDGAVAKKTLVIDNTGSAKYLAIARATGTTVVEIVEKDTATAPLLNTCMLHVADRTGCGDGTGEAGEGCATCSDDCGTCEASCGDGFCTTAETCTSCALDCGACTSSCADGTCNATESCQNCSADCGTCAASCGDGTCNGTETCTTCAADCGACPPSCGDGTCNGTETCSTCTKDCGACPSTCVNGKCDATETCTTCPAECGTCPPTCGDSVCNGTETCSTCAKDCGACAPKCGDLLCNNGETCSSCAGDCGPCGAACDPAATSLPNGKHKPGSACNSCHSGGSAGKFTVSGTAYTTIGGAAAVSGATITVTDANGKVVKLITASNGNFYSPDTSLKGPFKVVASKCPGVKQMNGDVTGAGGDCNSCHKSSNRIYIQ